MARSDVPENSREPRKVKLKRRKESFGFKVRGQIAEGGPRWLINGHEYPNLQTVSDVLPESPAEEGGIFAGDRILSINGIEVEGIQHDSFKELMKGAGDEVELVVITPLESKMLDIPTSVVIHKSDGSTLNINDTTLQQYQSIDGALHAEEINKEEHVAVQVHKLPSEEVIQEDGCKNNGGDKSGALDEKMIVEDIQKKVSADAENGDDQQKVSVFDEERIENDSQKEETVEIENGDNVSIDKDQTIDHEIIDGEDIVSEQDVGTDDSTCIEKEGCADRDSQSDSEEEPELSADVVHTSVASNSFFDKDSVKHVDPEQNSENFDTIKSDEIELLSETVASFDSVSCSCGQGAITLTSQEKSNSYQREMEKIQSQMRIMSSTKKRKLLSPFSPDIYNNLSPYFSNRCIKDDNANRQTRSWRYNQRPTSLTVLDPSEALRLESPLLKHQISAWSSNLSKRQNSHPVINEEATQRIRQDVLSMHRRVARRKAAIPAQSKQTDMNRKANELAKQFAEKKVQRTLITYLGL